MMSRRKLDGAGARFVFGFHVSGHASKHFDGAADALEARLAAQHLQGLKQRRRFLAPAHRHADGLEHLAGLDLQFRGARAQSGVQAGVRELGRLQGSRGSLQHRRAMAASPFCGISSAGS